MIVANYTIQFLPPRIRQAVIDKIYQALNWGGAFCMFEKVRAPDGRFQDYANQVYVEFKLESGFNEAEIVNKTRSIKGVMEPFSTQGNLDLLRRAGFIDVMTIQKYVCFEGFLAIKCPKQLSESEISSCRSAYQAFISFRKHELGLGVRHNGHNHRNLRTYGEDSYHRL